MGSWAGGELRFYLLEHGCCSEYSTLSFTSVSNPPGPECKADVRWCQPQFCGERDGLFGESRGVGGGALTSLLPVTLLAPQCLPWALTFLSRARQVIIHLHRARHFRYSEEFLSHSARLNNPNSWERSTEFVSRWVVVSIVKRVL